MKYWTTKLFDILIKILRQYPELIFIVFVILFITFVSLITWMYVSFKKQSKQTTDAFLKQVESINEAGIKRSENINKGLSNIQVGFDSAVQKMSEEIGEFQRLMIKYEIINEKILVKDFDKIKDMVKIQADKMIDTVVYLLVEHFDEVDPFDVADIIVDNLQDSSSTRRNDLKTSKIPARVIEIYENAEADIHVVIDGFVLKFVKKANNILKQTSNRDLAKDLIDDVAKHTKDLIVQHFMKTLKSKLSVKE